MNILTKICIVVVALASMVAAPVFIDMVTVPENYKALLEKEKASYGLLQATSKAFAEEAKRLRARLKTLETAGTASTSRLQATIDDLNREKADLTVKLNSDTARVAAINAKLTQLTKTAEAQAETITTLQGQVRTSWKGQSRQQATIIELSSALEEAKALIDRLEKSNKVHIQNLHDAQATIIELNRKLQSVAKGEASTTETKVPPTPAKVVSGSVTAVSGVLVSVNLGSAHDLKVGMELTVYRGSSYVGTMRVEQVEVGEAAGTLTTKVLAPRAGDKVTSDISK